MTHLSSYQKLKLEIKKLKADKAEIIKAVAEDNYIKLEHIKSCYLLERDIEKNVMLGGIKSKNKIMWDELGHTETMMFEDTAEKSVALDTDLGLIKINESKLTKELFEEFNMVDFKETDQPIMVVTSVENGYKITLEILRGIMKEDNKDGKHESLINIINHALNQGKTECSAVEAVEDETINFSPIKDKDGSEKN